MKRNFNDRLFLEKVAAVSGKDKQIVNDVLQSLLFVSTLEIFQNEDKNKQENTAEITIPYFCSLKLNFYNKLVEGQKQTVIDLQATASPALVEEITAIIDGVELPSKKYIKKKMQKTLKTKLEIEDSIDEELD